MAVHNLALQGVTYDDVSGVMTLTLVGPIPAPPQDVDESNWYARQATLKLSAPVRRATSTPPGGIYVLEMDDGLHFYSCDLDGNGQPVNIREVKQTGEAL